MKKITKTLQKFSNKDLKQAELVISSLISGNFKNLDIKKLEGKDDIFRVRKGKIRIIYKFEENEVSILEVKRRNEGTYRNI